MAMEANAANAAGSLQRVQRTQTTSSADGVSRRGDDTLSSPFTKETNVSIRNSIADLSAILGKISQNQEDTVDVLPEQLQKVIHNVMESSFSLSATLQEGLGSTAESQRFSMEQLTMLSRMLMQLGSLAEKGVPVSDFSENMQAVLQNLKVLLTSSEAGGAALEPALLNKFAFQLLDSKTLEELPAALQQALAALTLTSMQGGQGLGDSDSFGFLKSLVQYFLPRGEEAGASLQGQGQMQDQKMSGNPSNVMQEMGQGTAEGQQGKTAGTQGNVLPENSAARENQPDTSATGTKGMPQAEEAALPRQTQAGELKQGAIASQEPETSAGQMPKEGMVQGKEAQLMKDGSPLLQGQKEQSSGMNLLQANEETSELQQENAGARPGQAREAEIPNNARGATAQQGNPAPTEGKGQSSRGLVQDGQQTNSSSQKPQGGTMPNTAPRQMPVMQNTPQLMQALKDTAAFMLRNMQLSERDAALLRNFVNNGQKMLPDNDAKQLQLLLRLSQNNVPAAVNQAAVQQNLGDLPRLWAFMQLCDMAAVKDMKARQLKKAGKDVADFVSSMKQSMEGGSVFRTDGKGNTHRSLNFMLPLYMGEGEKQSFPAYANVYNEEKYSPEDGRMHKETWLRLCVLTDYIGAVELTCQVYDQKSLNMRVLFSDPSIVNEFKEYIPEFKASFKGTTLELSDLKVGVAGSKE